MTVSLPTADGVLISCCNVGARFGPYSLVYMRLSDYSMAYVDLAALPGIERAVAGITGLTRDDNGVYAAVQGGGLNAEPYVAVFDNQLRYQSLIYTPGARQTHAIKLTSDKKLTVVSTGTNEVYVVDPAKPEEGSKVLWAFKGGTTSDELHMNEFVELDGRRLILTHTPVENPGDPNDGTVYDIDSETALVRGLVHPHTLLPYKGGLLVCDSWRGRVLMIENGEARVMLEVPNRFFRGLCIVGDKLVIGSSSRRIFSRKQGLDKRLATEDAVIGDSRYMSFVLVADLNTWTVDAEIPFTEIGFEIYDVMPMPAPPAEEALRRNAASLRAQAFRSRMTDLEIRLKGVDDRAAARAARDGGVARAVAPPVQALAKPEPKTGGRSEEEKERIRAARRAEAAAARMGGQTRAADAKPRGAEAAKSLAIISGASKPTEASVPINRRFLFLCGIPRSGTTALVKLMNAHPDIALGIERFKYTLFGTGRGSDPFTPALFTHERFFDFRDNDTNVRADADYALLKKKYDDCTMVGDKIPLMYRRVSKVFKEFPEAQMVYITRDAAPVGLSWQKRADNEKDQWPSRNGFEAALNEWNNGNKIALDLVASRPGHFHVVNYEDVFNGDIRSVETLLQKIGMESNAVFRKRYAAMTSGGARSSTALLTPEQHRLLAEKADFALYEKLKDVAVRPF